jgi:hypothetical protein
MKNAVDLWRFLEKILRDQVSAPLPTTEKIAIGSSGEVFVRRLESVRRIVRPARAIPRTD